MPIVIRVDISNAPAEELAHALNRAAGTTNLDAQGAANVWAGTVGKELLGALNAKAGTTGYGLLRVLNLLAGTSNLGVNAAAAYLGQAATPTAKGQLARAAFSTPF